MHDIRALAAVYAQNFENRADIVQRIETAAVEADWNEPQPRGTDTVAVVAHAGRDDDVSARVPQRLADGQTMGQEIPILADQN